MKKLLLVAFVAAFGFTANAQDDTQAGYANGDVFVSGAIGLGSTSQGDAKTNGFTFSPKVGFFVSDNIAVGAQIDLETSKEEVTVETKNTTFGAGVFGRYYFTPASQFSIFGELEAGISSTKEEVTGVDGEDKSNGFNLGLAPGVSYFVSNNFALEATFGVLGYSSDKADVDGAEASNGFNFGVDLANINLGLTYKF